MAVDSDCTRLATIHDRNSVDIWLTMATPTAATDDAGGWCTHCVDG
jgi:hypothetical protein